MAPAAPVDAVNRPLLAVVVALAVLAYANALGNGFVLDDIGIIVENPLVRSGADVRAIFTSPYWPIGASGVSADPALYRPLTVLTYVIDHALWGLNPAAFHAVNVAVHAAGTVLVFELARRLVPGATGPVAAAAIFAAHPLHTEAVTGIVGRADLLATLFFVAAFLCVRPRAAPSPLRLIAGAGCWLLALLSKEIAATLPLVLAADDWLHRREFPDGRAGRTRAIALRYGVLAVSGALYALLRAQAVSGGSQVWAGFAGLDAASRVLTASRVMMEYLGLFVAPVRLLADYWVTEVPIARSVADPAVLFSLALWTAIGAAMIRGARREPAAVLAAAWFFATLLPVSNLLFPIGVAKAERLTYLPSVGLCLVAGWGLARLGALVRHPWPARAALAAVVVLLAGRTWRRTADWKDNLTLAQATLARSPASPLMNDIAAGELMRLGRPEAALPLLERATREAPAMAFLRTHLGTVYAALGRRDDAIVQYQEALRLDPADGDAHNNVGVALMTGGREEEAIHHFRAAIGVRPAFPDPHMNLGVLYLGRGQLDSAMARIAEAARLNPESAEAHNNLGVVWLRQGQRERAAAAFREALRLNPTHAKARENLDGLQRP